MLFQLDEIQQYDVNVAKLRHTPYMDYPMHVHLETMAHCNASCNFCPYPQLNRKGERMSDELIDKILTELTDVPRELPFQISPFKVSEPFLEKRLFAVMAKINDLLPQATITLTTNATPITEEKLKSLSQIANIGFLWVSFNDHRSAEYEATMGLPYDRTMERLQMLHAWRAARRIPFRVVLSRVGDGSPDDDAFRTWVSMRFPAFEAQVFPRGNWLGQIETDEERPYQDIPNAACKRWFELSITATGQVAHCCMDGQNQFSIGDVREQHVLEVYNGAAYRKLRAETVSRQHVAPCNSCTFL